MIPILQMRTVDPDGSMMCPEPHSYSRLQGRLTGPVPGPGVFFPQRHSHAGRRAARGPCWSGTSDC